MYGGKLQRCRINGSELTGPSGYRVEGLGVQGKGWADTASVLRVEVRRHDGAAYSPQVVNHPHTHPKDPRV